MTFPEQAPVREITPEQRQRSQRTFWLILLAVVAGVGLIVAVLSVAGRAARNYGLEAARAAQTTSLSEHLSYDQKCRDLTGKPLPRGVLDCTVEVRQGQVEAVVQVEGDRQYRVKP